MDEVNTRVEHLQINHKPSHVDDKLSTSFAMGFTPPSQVLKKFGNLYLYFEADPGSDAIKTSTIINACGRAYYQNTQGSIEARLKMALRALNEVIKAHKGRYSMGVIAIYNGTALFSNTEGVEILLARGSNTNIISSISGKGFQEIKEGALNQDDRIVMLGSMISKSLGHKALDGLITLNSRDIDPMLKKTLKIPEAVPYSLLVIDYKTFGTKEPKSIDTTDNADISGPIHKESLPSRITKPLKGAVRSITKNVSKSAKYTKNKFVPAFLSRTKQSWTDFWTKYVNPNPKQAIIVVIITTIIITTIILISVGSINSSSDSRKQLDNASMLIKSASESVASNNQGSAREYLNKSKEILNKIPWQSRQSLDKQASENKALKSYSSVNKDIQDLQDKLDNITRVNSSNSFDIPSKKLNALIYTADHLFGIDPSSGSIIDINPLFGPPIKRAENADLKNTYSTADLSSSGFVALGNTNLWQFTPDGGLIQLKSTGLPQSTAVATYLNNIYLISPADNQVVRYTKTGSNLTGKTNMLRNTTPGELNGTKSLAVFGNIFVAKNNGIILYEQGEERSFKINNLPSNFGGIQYLYYNQAGNYFLVLNSDSKRLGLLELDSEAAYFKKSFALTNDAIISSFTMDPKTSQIFVNSESKIISFKLEK